MKDRDEFRWVVESLKVPMKVVLARQSGDEWLRTLYQSYHQRFLSDNHRIWITGGILISVSLATFAVPVQLGCLPFAPLLVLGFASISLMFSWIIIAENHRAFQEKSRAWIVAIEEIIDIQDTASSKISENWITRSMRVQTMRWFLGLGVLAGWAVIWVDRALNKCV
jgi:hypothetical protein